MQIKLFGYVISARKSSGQESSGQTYIAVCDPNLIIVKRYKAITLHIKYRLIFLRQKCELFVLTDEEKSAGYTLQKVTFERIEE
jgi:hypothetical protein